MTVTDPIDLLTPTEMQERLDYLRTLRAPTLGDQMEMLVLARRLSRHPVYVDGEDRDHE